MELHSKNDEQWLRLLMQGEVVGLQHLIRVYFPILRRYAIKVLNTTTFAEDIVEDVIVKMWERKETFTCPDEIKGFLYTSVRNSCINSIRSRQREHARFHAFTQMHEQEADISFGSEIIYSEVLADLRKSVDTLPVKMREVFILSHFKEMSNQDIANHLNLSQQTVRNQKTRAFRLVKQWFNQKRAFR